MESIAHYCESMATLAIFVIPASNDAGFDPSRSVLAPETTRSERIAFSRAVTHAHFMETRDGAVAVRMYRQLVESHPEFAETHFRLAKLVEQTGRWDEAKRHYTMAREADAQPLRCREPFRQAYREVARRHPELVLIDGPKLLEDKSPHGIVDDFLFHDAQHPNLRGYVILAEELLGQLSAQQRLWMARGNASAVCRSRGLRQPLPARLGTMGSHLSARSHIFPDDSLCPLRSQFP